MGYALLEYSFEVERIGGLIFPLDDSWKIYRKNGSINIDKAFLTIFTNFKLAFYRLIKSIYMYNADINTPN